MDATSHSLLCRAGSGVADAWDRLDRLYRPFLRGWFLAHGVHPADAEDLAQDVMVAAFRELKAFVHSGQVGAFRSWLRGVCLHRLQGYRRSLKLRGTPEGGTRFQAQLHEVVDPAGDLAGDRDREHDRELLRQLLANLAGEFEEKTLEAFRRLAFDGLAAPQAAAELGMSVAAVYIAKSRVLRRLRMEAAGLIDENSAA
jgi:RNA polymerase sigma-70 factor (ECF subfamily)